ncbi:tRNA-splicing endonuclease subunit Sen54 isoform X3 [Pangasianodon hypophthalmus]|uniref:tRNA-splicing endonuclease subunit Sen54 isoform X3 n=1 Tax=Pangasianodon hypophthalmus TaxID=310915 RepID=UPI002307DE5B|nr:tRNA-splicing endonuclease subunit Sen54 isoform X3 [Pangasianodon hypophthalmus]
MAANDIQPEPVQIYFSNELLSSPELFQRRSQNHKIPVRGQKEFLPNDSVQQIACLQKTLDEHWMLVTEERVERVGNLVNADWIPEEKLVKLQSPAGKFWQTMGFSDQGKQCLFPEEALYLMESEGYESFLSDETVTLLQYQTIGSGGSLVPLKLWSVFGHLKRLGYVVNRFDTRLPSLCKQQLNLHLTTNRPSRQPKRKWSQSPSFRPCNKKSTASPEESAGQHEGEIKTSVPYSSMEDPGQLQTQQAFQDEILKSDPELDRAPGRTWWTNISSQPQPDSFQTSVRSWDFSCIFFPDLGSLSGNCACLPPPNPSLLPGALQVPECHMAHWHRNINLKEEYRSKQKQQREQHRQRCNINDDQGVRRCRNWVEYLDLVKKRRSQQHNKRLIYLREQEVMPLSQPGKCSSHRELLEQVNIIQSYDLLVANSRLPGSDQWRINFNVYQPDTEFKKSYPGKPYTRLCVCSFDGPVPNLHVLKQLSFQSGDVSVTFAVVDHGDISFYCFKEFKLPTDVH